MPTSSQARILSREDVSHIQRRLFARFHNNDENQRRSSENGATNLPHHLSTISLPHLNLMKSCPGPPPAYANDITDPATPVASSLAHFNGVPRRLPTLPDSRVPHLICYPSRYQNGIFGNVSNNKPSDNVKEPSDQGCSKAESQAQGAGSRKVSISEAAKSAKRRKSTSQRRMSLKHRQPSEDKPGPSRSDSAKKRSRVSASSSLRKSTEEEDLDETPPPSLTLEVNLLESRLDSRSEQDVSPADTDVDPEPEVEPEPEPASHKPKFTIKVTITCFSLYKQLLSIGMSANAFRGVVVQTRGQMKNATEEEAEQALHELASGMVEKTVEEEFEEEEEDVELVMGSLLMDVGNECCIQVATEKEELLKPEILHKEQKSANGIAESLPIVQAPLPVLPLYTPHPPSPPSRREDVSVDLRKEAGAGYLRNLGKPSAEHGLTKGKVSSEDAPHPPDKTTAEEKAFLQSVAAGAAYKSQTKSLKPAAAPIDTAPKKKVLKLPPVRLRRVMPPSNPYLLCIRTPNVELTHEQVKNMLEAQLGNIVSLQNDPEYLQHGDINLSPRVMWIFRMEDTSDSNYIRICLDGLIGFDGETLRIRKRDDVYREENRAYELVQQIKNEQARYNKNRARDRKFRPSTQQQPAKVKAA